MIYVSQISQWLEKRFNAKGGNVIDDVDIVARAILPWLVGVEDRYLQGWNRFSGAASVAANAANNSAVRLRNPVGSNCIIVIESYRVGNAVSTNSFFNLQQGAATNDLTTTSSGFRNDTRGNPNSVAVISSQNTTPANLGSGAAMLSIGANIIATEIIQNEDQQWVLLPGDATQVLDNTQNETLVVNFRWRERKLELSELT